MNASYVSIDTCYLQIKVVVCAVLNVEIVVRPVMGFVLIALRVFTWRLKSAIVASMDALNALKLSARNAK